MSAFFCWNISPSDRKMHVHSLYLLIFHLFLLFIFFQEKYSHKQKLYLCLHSKINNPVVMITKETTTLRPIRYARFYKRRCYGTRMHPAFRCITSHSASRERQKQESQRSDFSLMWKFLCIFISKHFLVKYSAGNIFICAKCP